MSDQQPYRPASPADPSTPPGPPMPTGSSAPAGYSYGRPDGQPVYPYGQPYGVPPVRYAPLTRRQKRAAFVAGGVGLNLMSLGASILTGALLVGILLVIFAGISASAESDSGLQGFDDFLGDVNAPLWAVAIIAVGLLLLGAGMFASVAILQRGGVRRPWAVTWSAFAITIPLLVVVNFVVSFAVQIVSTVGSVAFFASSAGGEDPFAAVGTAGIVLAIVTVVISIAVLATLGALAWWWMAHAFRERVPVAA